MGVPVSRFPRLLDAGLTLFAQKGVDGVTVSELEEVVGLSPGSGSFYRHFAGRDSLLEAIIEREIERAGQRRAREQDALKDPDIDIRQALAQQFRLTLTGLRDNAELINLLARATDHFPALMEQLRRTSSSRPRRPWLKPTRPGSTAAS